MTTDQRSSDSDAIFIDTNVLVYATIPSSAWHAPALGALAEIATAGSDAWISNQVIRELLVHNTRPDVRGTRTTGEIVQQATELTQMYRVADDTEAVREALIDLVERHDVRGKPIHDANLVATCLAYQIPRLLTHNLRDFKRYADELEVVPLTDA